MLGVYLNGGIISGVQHEILCERQIGNRQTDNGLETVIKKFQRLAQVFVITIFNSFANES